MPLLPVRSLFWRAFLTFWSAMALILVCGMLFTAAVAWYRVNSLDGLNPGSLAHDAAQIAREDGADGLERWVAAMDARYSALNIYLVDASDHDILGRALPARLRDWLRTIAPRRPTHSRLVRAVAQRARVLVGSAAADAARRSRTANAVPALRFLTLGIAGPGARRARHRAVRPGRHGAAVLGLTRNVTAPLGALRLATQACRPANWTRARRPG